MFRLQLKAHAAFPYRLFYSPITRGQRGVAMESRNTQQGFTLVELAIVMILIGIVSAGVLKGQEMIRQSRVKATIAQVQSYQRAYRVFQETYRFLPGDMPAAQSVLPNCATANSCFNGDGDKRVGNPAATGPEYPFALSWSPINPSVSSEHAQFWRHLALAGLIDGVETSGDEIGFGYSIPTSLYKGGFYARWAGSGSGIDSSLAHGNILVLRGNVGGSFSSNYYSVSPYEAVQIDRLMDDGVAFSGSVRAISGGHNIGCGNANLGVNDETGFAQSLTAIRCELHFMLDH